MILVGVVPLDRGDQKPQDVRQWRSNLEEENGDSGGRDIIFNKFGCICKERKMEGAELRNFFF